MFLNVKGHEPNGMVAPGEYEGLRALLALFWLAAFVLGPVLAARASTSVEFGLRDFTFGASGSSTPSGEKPGCSYLKFTVSGLPQPIQSARLRLFVTDASPVGGSVSQADNNYLGCATPWAEDSLKWSNAPAIAGPTLSSVGAPNLNAWVVFDVTAALTGDGVYSFDITSSYSNIVYYSLKEGGSSPQLVVQLAP